MKTIFETSKRVVTIIVRARKCREGEYIITPCLVYTKGKPCENDNGTNVAKKSFFLGWLKGYVEIEWTTEKKPVVAQKD